MVKPTVWLASRVERVGEVVMVCAHGGLGWHRANSDLVLVESMAGLASRSERVGEVVTVEPTVGLTYRCD